MLPLNSYAVRRHGQRLLSCKIPPERIPAAPSALEARRSLSPTRYGFLLLVGPLLACYSPSHVADLEEPVTLNRFEVRDSRNLPIWLFDCDSPPRISTIDHGILPIGCKQIEPPSSTPRLFRPAEGLLLIYTHRTDGQLRFHQHWGKAQTERTFLGGAYLQGPVGSTPLDKIFVPGERPIYPNYPSPR